MGTMDLFAKPVVASVLVALTTLLASCTGQSTEENSAKMRKQVEKSLRDRCAAQEALDGSGGRGQLTPDGCYVPGAVQLVTRSQLMWIALWAAGHQECPDGTDIENPSKKCFYELVVKKERAERAMEPAVDEGPDTDSKELTRDECIQQILSDSDTSIAPPCSLLLANEAGLPDSVIENLLKDRSRVGSFGDGQAGNSVNPGWWYCGEYPVLEALAKNPDLKPSYLEQMIDLTLACDGYYVLMAIAQNPTTSEKALAKIENKLKKHADEYDWDYAEYGKDFQQILKKR